MWSDGGDGVSAARSVLAAAARLAAYALV